MNTVVTTRLMTPEDEDAFKKLMNEYVQEYMETEKTYPVHFDPKIGGVYWDELMSRPQDFIVVTAEYENNLIGLCIGEVHRFGKIETVYFDGDRRGEVWDFYVQPEYRSQGIGKMLLTKMEEEFLNHGCKNIVLTGVNIDNDRSRKLYERLGYKAWNVKYYKALE